MFTKDDVADFRSVNGEPVSLSDAERQAIADEWNANLDNMGRRMAAADLETKRRAACAALEEQRLAAALSDTNAPPEVKAYKDALDAVQPR